MPEATSATDRPHVGNPKLSGTFKHCAVQHEAVSAQAAATQRCWAAVFLGRFLPKLGGASRCRPFFAYAGRARGARLSHGLPNEVNRTYAFALCSTQHFAVAMGNVGCLMPWALLRAVAAKGATNGARRVRCGSSSGGLCGYDRAAGDWRVRVSELAKQRAGLPD